MGTKNSNTIEYEMFFKSKDTDSIKIDGWYPIETPKILNPEKIEHYIEIGILRRINKITTMEIKNSFWFRHFLMCNRLATLMVSARGWCVENFAKTIIESENGRFANNQMNIYFQRADTFLCELHESEEDMMFDFLEEEGITIDNLAELSTEQLNNYYDQYCVGFINFSNTHENS